MKTLLKTLTIILAITLSSCSSDDDGSNLPQDQKIRLANYTKDDVTFNMTYNEDGMLTKYQYGNTFTVTSNIEYNTSGNITKVGPLEFIYDAQGKITEINNSSNNTISTITYNSQGLIEAINSTYDDGGSPPENSETNLEYNSNGQLIFISEYIDNGTIASPYAKTSLSYDQNGNIIEQYIQRSNDGITYYDFSTTIYTYDNNKNPFHDTIGKTGITNDIILQQFIGLYSIYFSGQVGLTTMYFVSPNNLISKENSLKLVTYNYTYNEDNYPIIAEEINDASSSGGSVYTYNKTFTYETY